MKVVLLLLLLISILFNSCSDCPTQPKAEQDPFSEMGFYDFHSIDPANPWYKPNDSIFVNFRIKLNKEFLNNLVINITAVSSGYNDFAEVNHIEIINSTYKINPFDSTQLIVYRVEGFEPLYEANKTTSIHKWDRYRLRIYFPNEIGDFVRSFFVYKPEED